MGLSWFVFAITATLLWSVGSIIVKFVRVNHIKSSIGYLVITAPVTLFSLLLLIFGRVYIPSAEMLIYILITSITAFTGYWIYLIALHKEEVSKVITLFGIQPLVVLILATIFLREVLTIKDYLAFPLIIIGSMLISVKKVEERFGLSHGIILTLISILFFGIQSLFFKLVSEVDFVSTMILRQLGFLVIIFLLFISSKNIRKKTKEDLAQINKKKIPLVYLGEILGMTGIFFSFLAIQRGPVSLVTLVEGTEGLFVIILAALISIFVPKILKEEITKKTISLKIISALLIITGLYLIAI